MNILNVRSESFSPGDVKPVRPAPSPVDLTPKGAERVQQPVDAEALRGAIDKINRSMESQGNNIQFAVDSETSTNIVRVVDRATNETIRQFPSEETLAIAKALDKLQGLLIRVNA